MTTKKKKEPKLEEDKAKELKKEKARKLKEERVKKREKEKLLKLEAKKAKKLEQDEARKLRQEEAEKLKNEKSLMAKEFKTEKLQEKKELKLKNRRKEKIKHFFKILLFILFLFFLYLVWQRNYLTKYTLENIVSKIAKAKISLGSIDINEKGIYLENVEVESLTDIYYYAKTPRIDIELNYSAIFNHKLRFKEIVDSLYMETPVLKYSHSFEKSEEEKLAKRKRKEKKKIENKSESAPFDITNYVRKATITDSNVAIDIGYAPYFRITDTFTQANFEFDNTREETVKAQMTDNRNHPLYIGLVLNERGFASAELEAHEYNPDSLFIDYVDNLQLNLAGKAKFSILETKEEFLDVDLTSDQVTASIVGMDLIINNLKVTGTSDALFAKPGSVSFMGIPCEVAGTVLDIFDKVKLDAGAIIDHYELNKSFDFVTGTVNLEAAVNGYAEDLLIQAVVNSPSLELFSFDIKNIDAKLEYQQYIKVDLLNAEIDKNTLKGSGFVEKNYLSADLIIKNKEENIINLQGNLITKGVVIDDDAFFKLVISDLALGYNGFHLEPLFGFFSLDKDIITGYLGNTELVLELETDLALNDSKAIITFLDFNVGSAYSLFQQDPFTAISPLVNGSVVVSKKMNLAQTELNLELTGFNDEVYLPLKTDISWDLDSNDIKMTNNIMKGKAYAGEIALLTEVNMNGNNELDAEVAINNNISIKGKNLLNAERTFKLNLKHISLAEVKEYLPKELTESYPDGYVTLDLDYFFSSDRIKGNLNFTGIRIAGFSGYGLQADFGGTLEQVIIDNLRFYNERQILLEASGTISVQNGLVMNADAVINEIDFADYQNVFPFTGFLHADVNFRYDSKDEEKYGFRVKGVGSDFKISNFDIDDVYFNLMYVPQRIHIDNLYLNSTNYADLNVFGDFTYDIFKDEYIPSNERLYLKFDADGYKILKKLLPGMLESGKFDLSSELVLGINEEGLQLFEGYVNSERGYLEVAEQPDLIDNINIKAVIKDNELDLERFELKLGDGYLHISNIVSEEGDNFFIGGFTLGQFRIFTSQRDILVHIPQYMPVSESAQIKIAGTKKNYALIKGPFDDMKIDAEVTFSNGSVIYPPKTENLLTIIASASKSTFKKKKHVVKDNKDINNALPFDLNAKLIIGENFKYVTYPTNISLTPNSYLNLVYHNSEWSVPDAKFLAEEGKVTFLDTDFNVDLVEIMINEIELSIDASFSNKVEDGSTVTLRISNGQSNNLSLDDLTLTIESDNPDDKTESQAINRLRYSDSDYEMNPGGQTSLQDEAVLMLGANVDNTFFNRYLRPVETFFRRRLRVDYFYIRPGFVKNMLNNYVVGTSHDRAQEVTDSELAQFSSSILLNNLSVNLGRPIYKRFYFNYYGLFQEATNLNRKSKITYQQDFQVRANLDFKTKMSYTFKHRPSSENAHEVMIFHSLSF